MRRAWVAAAIAVAAAGVLVAAGCGGGGKKGYVLTKAEYASALDKICADFDAKREALGLDSIEALASKGDELVSDFEAAVDEAEALQVPDEVKETADAFIANGRQQIDVAKDLVRAAKDRDATKLNELAAQGKSLDDEGDRLAAELGATGCAKD